MGLHQALPVSAMVSSVEVVRVNWKQAQTLPLSTHWQHRAAPQPPVTYAQSPSMCLMILIKKKAPLQKALPDPSGIIPWKERGQEQREMRETWT